MKIPNNEEIMKLILETNKESRLDFTRPQYIYHYTSPEGLCGILKDKLPKLFFTQYDSLNDLKERIDIIDTLKEYCNLKFEEGTLSKKFKDDILDFSPVEQYHYFDKVILPDIGEIKTSISKPSYTYICSFSFHKDSLPMWRMYSKNDHFEGYNIGFLTTVFEYNLSNDNEYRLSFHKVIYDKNEKFRIFDVFTSKFCKFYDDLAEEYQQWICQHFKSFLFLHQFIFKNQSFEYENEFRAVLHVAKDYVDPNESCPKISKRKYRVKNGLIVPYVEVCFNANDIECVNIAPTINDEIAKANLDDFLKSKGLENVKIYNSEVPLRY